MGKFQQKGYLHPLKCGKTEKIMRTDYHVHIDSKKRFSLNLRELAGYRDLIVLMAKRDFSLKYKQTLLGPLWLVINPVLTSLIYVLVFSQVAGISTGGVPPILFYLVSTSMWSYVSSVFNQVSNTFLVNAYVFGKVYFPRLTVPVSNVLVSLVEFLIRLAVITALMIILALSGFCSVVLGRFLLLVPLLMWAAAMSMGLGLIISSLTVRFRDLRILAGFAMHLWMYASAVVFPLSQISSPSVLKLMKLNPAVPIMELTRKAVIGVGSVSSESIVISLAFALFVLLTGILLFNRAERNFLDTV